MIPYKEFLEFVVGAVMLGAFVIGCIMLRSMLAWRRIDRERAEVNQQALDAAADRALAEQAAPPFEAPALDPKGWSPVPRQDALDALTEAAPQIAAAGFLSGLVETSDGPTPPATVDNLAVMYEALTDEELTMHREAIEKALAARAPKEPPKPPERVDMPKPGAELEGVMLSIAIGQLREQFQETEDDDTIPRRKIEQIVGHMGLGNIERDVRRGIWDRIVTLAPELGRYVDLMLKEAVEHQALLDAGYAQAMRDRLEGEQDALLQGVAEQWEAEVQQLRRRRSSSRQVRKLARPRA